MWTTISQFIGSAVIAALVTAIFTKLNTDKSVRIENITKERKEWRGHVRTLVAEANAAFYDKDKTKINTIKANLQVRLNPGDPQDNMILETLGVLPTEWDPQQLNNFNHRMAGLLKHDWERVKTETSRTVSVATLTIVVVALTGSIALIVWSAEWAYLLKTPPLYVLFVGAVLLVIPGLWWINSRLHKYAKNRLDRQRETKWQPYERPNAQDSLLVKIAVWGWYPLWIGILALTAYRIRTLATAAPALMYLIFILIIVALVSPPYFADKHKKQEAPLNGVIAVGLLVAFIVTVVIVAVRHA